MKKTKLSDEDIKKVADTLKNGLERVNDRANGDEIYRHSLALGMAESIIENAINQLNGIYPIF